MHKSNLNIMGIVKTHLVKENTVDNDGFKWYGHTRNNIHIHAKTGSGGTGLLVRNDFDELFSVTIVDDATDGIVWVQFMDKLIDNDKLCSVPTARNLNPVQ